MLPAPCAVSIVPSMMLTLYLPVHCYVAVMLPNRVCWRRGVEAGCGACPVLAERELARAAQSETLQHSTCLGRSRQCTKDHT